MNNLSSLTGARQKGYILITTLVLLVMVTALALTQAGLNSTQTRVATNATDSEISFEKTEGAVNEALNRLINSTYTSESFLRNNNGLYLFDQSEAPLWKTINWSSASDAIQSFQGNTSSQASYIIEQLPSVIRPGQNMKKPTRVYRVTGYGVGATGSTAVLLQSTLQIQQ